MHPRWEWFKVKEDGTGIIYELRPARVLQTMVPLPQVNSNIQFTLKDGLIDKIKCYVKEADEEETDETG